MKIMINRPILNMATKLRSGIVTPSQCTRILSARIRRTAWLLLIAGLLPMIATAQPSGYTATISPTTVTESVTPTNLTVTVNLTGGTFTTAREFRITPVGGTATSGDDYTPQGITSVTVPRNRASATETFPFTAIDDMTADGGETVEFEITLRVRFSEGMVDNTLGAAPRVTITINDAPPRLAFTDDATTLVLYYPYNAAITPITFPAATGGTTPYMYAPVGTLPAGLTFDADNRVLSGTPTLTGTSSFIYRGTDSASPAAVGSLEVTTVICLSGGTADGTTVCAPPTRPSSYTFAISPTMVMESATPTDVTFMFTLNGGTFNVDRVFLADRTGGNATSGTDYTAFASPMVTIPANMPSGRLVVPFTAIDDMTAEAGGETLVFESTLLDVPRTSPDPSIGRTQSRTITINDSVAPDTAPTFGGAMVPAQTYTQGTEITSLTLPVVTGGNGAITYSLADEAALPTGLRFNGTARPPTITGTPGAVAASMMFTYTAADGDDNMAADDAASLTFTITVTAPDTAPTFGGVMVPAQSYTQGTEITLTLPAATGGNGAITYSLADEAALPTGLSFDGAARPPTITGTPGALATSMMFTYTAADGDDNMAAGDAATLTFTIMVEADIAPTFASDATIPDQSYIINQMIEPLTLPEATGGNGALTHSISPPPGLDFNPTTLELTGTPTALNPDGAVFSYTVVDSDANSAGTDGDRILFRITVTAAGVDIAPTFGGVMVPAQSYTEGTEITSLTLPVVTGGNGAITVHPDPGPNIITGLDL